MALVRSDWVRMLRDDKVDAFNERASHEAPNLENGDLRGVDLRGLDLSEADLDGASLKDALVSGTLFPRTVPAHEIELSLARGTRMRADKR